MDPKNLSISDIQAWAQQASPDQVTQAAHKLLDRVANFDDTHRQNFTRGLNNQVRDRLFADEPVG